ncbi:hypothetical protein KOY48_02085 [Candidatus Minimicrobia naudis]|uniref:Uncharacterized protein n=1 Tax=Candidatus Minimicrobia naudis TaxID=2841263 RepID=A0A8F1MC15_9BACT|nr:hypothetical protein KOY48_02085 [Candidatus Minimicrobia naudis]
MDGRIVIWTGLITVRIWFLDDLLVSSAIGAVRMAWQEVAFWSELDWACGVSCELIG